MSSPNAGLAHLAAGESKFFDRKERLNHLNSAVTLFHEMGTPSLIRDAEKTTRTFTSPPETRRQQPGIIAASPQMRAILSQADAAKDFDDPILIEGETGVGKDLAASAIHGASARKDGPFVVVDCGAMPANLLESELFGHVRGAFTGAQTDRAGAFEAADGGTLFLDELGELELDLQPKLLRALESRKVKRIGANAFTPVDVRVIAATNRNLTAGVNGKAFRADTPVPWSPVRYASGGPTRKYDLHPDGKRVIVAGPDPTAAVTYDRLVFVFNFFKELDRLLPAKATANPQ